MKKSNIPVAISYFFILLFLYTSLSKLLAFDVTLFDMRRNPLLGNAALFWTIAVPLSEIIVSVLLFVPKTRRIGLFATLVLMVGFTGYVGVLLASDYKLPCTCGGIFRELTWQQHFWVNLGLVAPALTGIFFHKRNQKSANVSFTAVG